VQDLLPKRLTCRGQECISKPLPLGIVEKDVRLPPQPKGIEVDVIQRRRIAERGNYDHRTDGHMPRPTRSVSRVLHVFGHLIGNDLYNGREDPAPGGVVDQQIVRANGPWVLWKPTDPSR